MSDALTAACDPTQWMTQSRHQMLEAAGLTARDLQRAVTRHRKLLNAKRVKLIQRDGVITEHVSDDCDAQLRAVDIMYDVAGVKAPRAQHAAVNHGVEVVIEDGRIIVRAVST